MWCELSFCNLGLRRFIINKSKGVQWCKQWETHEFQHVQKKYLQNLSFFNNFVFFMFNFLLEIFFCVSVNCFAMLYWYKVLLFEQKYFYHALQRNRMSVVILSFWVNWLISVLGKVMKVHRVVIKKLPLEFCESLQKLQASHEL